MTSEELLIAILSDGYADTVAVDDKTVKLIIDTHVVVPREDVERVFAMVDKAKA